MCYRCTSLTSGMTKRIAEVTTPDQSTWNCRSRRRPRVRRLDTRPVLQRVDHRSPTRARRPSVSRRPSPRQRRCCWIWKGWRHAPRRRRRELIPLRSCLGRRRLPRQRCVIPDQARGFIQVQSRGDQQWLVHSHSLFLELLLRMFFFFFFFSFVLVLLFFIFLSFLSCSFSCFSCLSCFSCFFSVCVLVLVLVLLFFCFSSCCYFCFSSSCSSTDGIPPHRAS